MNVKRRDSVTVSCIIMTDFMRQCVREHFMDKDLSEKEKNQLMSCACIYFDVCKCCSILLFKPEA